MESVVSSPLLYNLALTLIHFIWQGCLIALSLKFLLILISHQRPQIRYALSMIAMLACLVVPVATYWIIYQPIYTQDAALAMQTVNAINTTNMATNEEVNWYQGMFDSLPYVSILWLSTVTFLASKLLIELYNVNQLPKLGIINTDENLQRRFQQLVTQIELKKTPKLLISIKVNTPMAIGWLKPIVLIPAAMLSGLTPAQLDMLILHELAHIRRNDYLVNFIQTIIETLLFFHPAVSWISKQMRNEREYCSDDIAVNIAGNPIAYAHTLADTASICTKHRHHAIPTMVMAASGGDLKQRVVRLVDQHNCTSNDDSGKFLASVLIIFSIFIVAIKPYLSHSMIDFTTGRISLFKSANEYIQNKPAHAANLSATSIAQLLLQQDKKINTTIISPQNETTSDENLTRRENPTIPNSTKDTFNDMSVSTPPPIETTTVKMNPIAENSLLSFPSESKPQNKSQQKVDELATDIFLAKSQSKSMSEKAFERTDSHNNDSKMTSPYTKQIASLVNEPMTIETQEKSSPTTPVKKPMFDLQPKPRFVITNEKTEVVKPQAPVKRPAEILSSIHPKYPSMATRKGIEMDVTVSFSIDKDGLVHDLIFEQKSKVSFFRNAIRSALSKWRFLPAQVNGLPVESKMTKNIFVQFREVDLSCPS